MATCKRSLVSFLKYAQVHSRSLGIPRGSATQNGSASACGAVSLASSHSTAFHNSSAASFSSGVATSALKGSEAVALVQGSDRGIGLEFVEQLLSRYSNTRVVATCKDPAGAEHLDALHDQSGGRLEIVRLDVTDEDTIKEAAEAVKAKYGRLNVLLNCSGIFHVPNLLQPETSMRWLNAEAVEMVFWVNALGPMLVTKHMVPLLVDGAQSKSAMSVVANMSSRTGSIAENLHGGWYSYRASKAALNQFTRTTAAELADRHLPVAAVALHPGTVDTDLTRPFQKYLPPDRLFTKQFAVSKLLDIIEGLTPADNGRFIAWDGQDVPW